MRHFDIGILMTQELVTPHIHSLTIRYGVLRRGSLRSPPRLLECWNDVIGRTVTKGSNLVTTFSDLIHFLASGARCTFCKFFFSAFDIGILTLVTSRSDRFDRLHCFLYW